MVPPKELMYGSGGSFQIQSCRVEFSEHQIKVKIKSLAQLTFKMLYMTTMYQKVFAFG